jgi:signal transduction histidine kinase
MSQQIIFKKRLYFGFILAILLSAASGFTSYFILQKQQDHRVWVRKARSILDTTTNVQSTLIDMETGIRGYRVTNQKRYLDPYYTGLKRIHTTLDTLKFLLADDPEVGNIEQILDKHVQDLLGFWNNIVGNEVVYINNIDVTNDVNKTTDDEKKQMDEIRSLVKELQKDETKLLNNRREENDHLVHYIVLSTSIESIISVTLILILIYFIFREFRRRVKIQDELHNSVIQLKEKTEILEKSEAELKVTSEELGAINRQLEKFVYMVAHDIKSPLSGIVGALKLIATEDEIIENPKLARFITLSSESALYLTEKINFLLEYYRVTSTHLIAEPVNTKELLEQVTILLFPPKNVRIYITDDMPVFNTYKLKIIQVFQNLISNAIKYSNKETGIIDIGFNEKDGDYYEFFVKDNGQGIAPEFKDKIFTLSRTTNNISTQDSSTGFGLNIAKMIVEEQGGTLWFESIPGQGATFYFEWKK